MRFSELSGLLQNRGYKIGIIEAAIEKARKIYRKQAIKRVVKPQTTRRFSGNHLYLPIEDKKA